jgi:site-specific recombinase XerD
MQWNWVNFNNHSITVKCSNNFTTKSKKERLIPLTDNLIMLLHDRFSCIKDSSSGEYVFTRIRGIKLYHSFISKKFKKAVRLAGLDEKIHFHTLRHSFASLLVQRGVSLYVVKELLGHEDLTTTQIYSHLKKENLFEAISVLSSNENRIKK